MRMKPLLRNIFLSWDWPLALFIVVFSSYLIAEGPTIVYVNELFSTSISILAIVFSVFLTSLAVLITAGDNEFVRFLEEDGSYTRIIATFKLTLTLLSVSFISSVVLYAITLRLAESQPDIIFSRWILLTFSFFGLYSLLATIQSAFDMLKYSEFRARFLSITKTNRSE